MLQTILKYIYCSLTRLFLVTDHISIANKFRYEFRLVSHLQYHLVDLVFSFQFFGMGWDCVHSVRRPLNDPFYQPRMIDDECGAVSGMRIGRGNRSTRRKPAPMPLCPPQIPHCLTWARNRASVFGSRRLTARAMARLSVPLRFNSRQLYKL
jgi:hypothetical protein